MLRALIVTLSLTAAFATSASAPSVGLMRLRGGADFKDKATGILFPEHLKAGGSDLQFLGAGERKKAILGPVAVNVYAIGLYVDSAAAKRQATGIKDAAAVGPAILDGTYTKALRLVMARTVTADKIGDALADQLEPRLKGTDAPVDQFKAFFKSFKTLETNQEVIFTQHGSTLEVKAPSASTSLPSGPLCKALFDIYLGDKPVSTTAKASIADGLLKLVGTK